VITVPRAVRNKARAFGAESWLAALPALVAELEHQWSIVVGAQFEDPTEAFVAAATRADGTDAVLKLNVPRPGDATQEEVTALRIAGGDGCVALFEDDIDRGALLLERLGPSLHDLGLPIGQRHEILCATARRVWRPAPDSGLWTGAAKAEWLIAEIARRWDALDHPCSERAVDHAIACARRRIAAHDDERAVLVHGDVHEWNALEAGSRFKLVDPDGLLAEAEYDLGIIMREDPVELMQGDPFARATWLASRCGLDADAIWEWGVVERVSTGLLGTEIDLQPVAREMLAAADALAASAWTEG
jgi:streptomycin 6-kinase